MNIFIGEKKVFSGGGGEPNYASSVSTEFALLKIKNRMAASIIVLVLWPIMC